VRAFIVRPFGTRNGIAFDRVESDLIAPVLDELGIAGRTTQEIARAGNIRTDMFRGLLVADLVIADISIHNANVYYELGIRHALRDCITVLIRARVDEVPFDLRTDRYLEYDPAAPEAARDLLRAAIEQSAAEQNADSPVFLLLPNLRPADPEVFQPVPEGFTDEVRAAHRQGDLPMLAVLTDEAAEADWELAGLRLVGTAQFDLQGWRDARATWERIRRLRPDEPDARLKLGTILQRLGDVAASSEAIERVLERCEVAPDRRAEAWALLGSNAKTRWQRDWHDEPNERRAAAALRSPHLDEARIAYDKGFLCDQNHWYSGINSLALLTVVVDLAEREPEVWTERFEDDDEAARALAQLTREREVLTGAVRRSIAADEFRRAASDVWLDLTKAEITLLTTSRPPYVAKAYRDARARLADADGEPAPQRFPAESAARQIRLFLALGVLADNARAALEALEVPEAAPSPPVVPRARTIVFAGHRIDNPQRPTPRFPAAAEATAAERIRAALEAEKALAGGGPVDAIAGGASGGDILFHEQCVQLGIPSTLMLALPRDAFAAASVEHAGPEWIERFRALCGRLEVKTLADSEALPGWLAVREDYSIWQRNNRWILHTALSRADTDVTLIVLWDGKGGDGPGGTKDMVALARARGVKVVHIDTTELW
jgi:hypothetical protein